jgi:hypothetical protein
MRDLFIPPAFKLRRAKNDEQQRDIKNQIRELERAGERKGADFARRNYAEALKILRYEASIDLVGILHVLQGIVSDEDIKKEFLRAVDFLTVMRIMKS